MLELIQLDPPLRSACTEVALLTKARAPTMLLEYETYLELSLETRKFIADYPVENNESSIFNFFHDLYVWDIIDNDSDTDNPRPTYVGVVGELLINK